MSTFNLPPPWDPGYALPSNVRDEGLERRGMVTQWAPRGTYDEPKVGDGDGYDVPRYIRDEGYGAGAVVTKWAPRGTYYGGKIPHWLDRPSSRVLATSKLPGGAVKMQIQAMAGTEQATTGSARVSAYAARSAAALVDTVRMMPPDMRSAQLRAMLTQIDPSLYGRAEAFARVEEKAGARPLVALERGIAAAMSLGLAKELVDLGKSGRIAKGTQLGALAELGAVGKGVGSSIGLTAFMAQFFHVGPFLIPLSGTAKWAGSTLSAAQWSYLRDAANQTHQAYKAAGWKNFNLRDVCNKGEFPLLKFVMPAGSKDAGKEYALYTKGKFYEQQDFVTELRAYKEPKETTKKSWWRRAWAAIKKIVVVIVEAVKDAAKWVKNQGCKLLSNPEIAQAIGAGAGAAVGGPVGAEAGMVGGQIAAEACGPKAAEKAAEKAADGGGEDKESGGGMGPLLLLGAVGVAGLIYMRSKK